MKVYSYNPDKGGYVVNSINDYERGEYFEKTTTSFDTSDTKDLLFWFAPKNNYPETTLSEINKGTTLQSILNEHSIYTVGEGLTSANQKVAIDVLDNKNAEGKTINDVYGRICNIIPKLGNAFVKVVTDEKRTFIDFYYIDAQKCRLKKTGSGVVEINQDWINYNKKDSVRIPLYPKFKKSKGETFESILHIKQDAEGYDYYGKIEQMDFALLLNEKQYRRHNWQKNQLKKGFKKDFVLLTNQLQNDETIKKHEEVQKRFGGDEKSGGIMPMQYIGDAKNPLIPISNDYKFDYSNDDTADALFELFGFPRSLIGIKSGAVFSVEQVESDYEQYLPKIQETQNTIIRNLNLVYSDLWNIENALSVVNMPPSIIVQNYFQYMEQPQINQVLEKYFTKYGIDIDFSQTQQIQNNG